MTASLYLCEFTESTGQLHQHASLLSFHRWWSRCALAGGCFDAYITALRQRADFIWKYTDGRAGVRRLWGVSVGTLELHSVSALETDITAPHICFRVVVRNTISSTLSFFYYISAVRWRVWSALLMRPEEKWIVMLYRVQQTAKTINQMFIWHFVHRYKVFSWKLPVNVIQDLD